MELTITLCHGAKKMRFLYNFLTKQPPGTRKQIGTQAQKYLEEMVTTSDSCGLKQILIPPLV